METILRKALRKPTAADTVYLVKSRTDLKNIDLSEDELEFVKREHRAKHNIVEINRYKNRVYVVYGDFTGTRANRLEDYRKQGNQARVLLNKARVERVVVSAVNASQEETLAFTEGLLLGNYQFLKYKKEAGKKENKLEEVDVYAAGVSEQDLEVLRIIVEAVYNARDMVNEPVSYLTATQFADEIKELGRESKAKVEVFNKKKIESLKMGGLLAVNKGSIDPPTFSVMEWKPKNKVNKKPYVFVGKGVVYDTGGLSLKPSNFMDTMKCDMAGGAAVAGAMYAIARAQLPVWVVALIPATDNRPDGNAYTPGDVIEMHDGSTVEVLNTDAEGRMILADALSYAKNYNPELVIDMATLTGAASRAIGPQAMVGMVVKAQEEFDQLQRAGDQVHERIVEFPMWDDYKEQIKSEIADLKNIGGVDAGAITAAKFLEHFTDYPYIHLDIAGPAFLSKNDSYRGIQGTGVGVRLLFDFIRSKVE
ncbi:MAG: leucyl aminopeptidase family protein [Bacteroidales bacterium]|nr:leucyl aminopeptidase family protein [Bacteroidales bacterium]